MPEIQIEIAATPEQVFHVVTDPELSKEWLKGELETIPVDGDMSKVGAKFKQRFRRGKKWAEYQGFVTMFEKNKITETELDNGPFVSIGRFEVEPWNTTNTALTMTLQFKGKTLGGTITALFLTQMARFLCKKQVESLKVFVESKYGRSNQTLH